jgi:hypothetical protein
MDASRSEPVVSGRDYSVDEVHGRPVDSLEQFSGETSFHVSRGTHHHQVVGVGVVLDGLALVHEKQGEDGGGLDVRVWHVRRGAGEFTAQHTAEH